MNFDFTLLDRVWIAAILDLQLQAVDSIDLFASHPSLLSVAADGRLSFFFKILVVFVSGPGPQPWALVFLGYGCISVIYDNKKTLLPFGEQGSRKLF